MRKLLVIFLCSGLLPLFSAKPVKHKPAAVNAGMPDLFIVILGIAQDAGYPQMGCTGNCCKPYWEGKEEKKFVSSLAIVDRKNGQYWLIDATPDIREQMHFLQPFLGTEPNYKPAGVFLTHAHIGHYTGLMEFGREVMGTNGIPVWAMPRMDTFLRNNGPWSQLVSLGNIKLNALQDKQGVMLNDSLSIQPFKVPHRDEYSETVGFVIRSKSRSLLYIPDIDKWEKWDRNINAMIGKVDVALLDGTFYRNGELPGRDMREVPHPFVEESMKRFDTLSIKDRSKIIFTHFNHTNPLLHEKSPERLNLLGHLFRAAVQGQVIAL